MDEFTMKDSLDDVPTNWDAPSPISMTHSEYMGEGYSVTVQHCDYVLSNGDFCNKYLGANYPSVFCEAHR